MNAEQLSAPPPHLSPPPHPPTPNPLARVPPRGRPPGGVLHLLRQLPARLGDRAGGHIGEGGREAQPTHQGQLGRNGVGRRWHGSKYSRSSVQLGWS